MTTEPRYRVATFGLDCLGNCTGWFIEDRNLPRTQLSDQRISELFVGNIYDPGRRAEARRRAYALADKLNRVAAIVVQQDNTTKAEIIASSPKLRLTAEDYEILADRAYGPIGAANASARALYAPEYVYSVNL